MPRRKQPAIPDALLDQLLDGSDPRTAFNPDGILDALKKALAERMLNAEMDQHLSSEASDGRANTRNGYGQKTVLTDTGRLALDIPRDRQGTFDPQLIAKYQRRFPGFDDKIVSLYARGMRYRHVQQVFSARPAGAVGCVMLGLRRPRLLWSDLERASIFGDAVDGVHELSHGGDERQLCGFSSGAQSFVESAQPWVAPDGTDDGHPECHAEPGVTDGRDGSSFAGRLAGLLETWNDAKIGGQGVGASKASGISDCCDDAGGGLGSEAFDGGEQLTDLMSVKQMLDLALDGGKAFTPEVEILTDMHSLKLVGGSVVLTDRGLCGLDQLLGQLSADKVTSVVAQPGQAASACASERLRSGIGGQQAGGEHAVEAADVAGELGETEVDQAMQLSNAVVEVLAQPVAVADQFAQAVGNLVVQVGGFRAFFEGEASEALCVDGVGFGALQICVLKAPGDKGIEQRDIVPGSGEDGEQVLPIVPGRLHRDEHGRWPERIEQGAVPGAVFCDAHGLADRGALVVQACEHVALGRDIDTCKHDSSVLGQRQGASELAPMLTLVQTRTQAG